VVFGTVSGEVMRTAQIVTGAAMALWLGAGLVPGLRKHAGRIRVAVLVLYLLTLGGFVVYLMLWR